MQIQKLSDILPLFDGKRSLKQVASLIEPKRSVITISRWVKKLREAGYTVNTVKRGKKKLTI